GTAIRNGVPDHIVITSRLVLIALLAALVYGFVILPRRRIDENGAADIEQRTEAFGGRVETYVEINDERNPMRELLAEDAARIAKEHPPDSQVAKKEFTFAYTVTAVAIAGLLFLAIAGPGNYAYGVRHLWFGWAIPGLLPPQSIEVIPGDDGIRLGGTVRVRATMRGFEPARAWVHASFGDGEWQQVEMSDEDELFAFTFFSVRQPLAYYVSAANVRSPTFKVKVVDLPIVENLVLEFTFPEWTRREPETHDPGGDVRAIADTQVEVTVRSDRVMTPGELIVDDQVIALEINGDTATATFTVVQDGQYFVAAKIGGEQIRLTDDYFITLLDDEIPRIKFVRPGRDWSASSIEEVTARISAEDDFALESLELRYSVNASEWQSIEWPVDTNVVEIDHVFFLESLSGHDAGAAMSPGDLISYYAIARDRKNIARTDIFFIDVQPFDRRYSQSQQSGGMGGQQGGQQSEISDRQREIIVSTWNLIRELSEQRRNDAAYVPDNAALLSRLQSTLRGQVETLAQRARARQLTATDEDIATFAEHLRQAGGAMIPAAEALSEMELEQAILPEQEALQHLLAAEAVFTDISVSLQANNRGRGGQAGRDLTEMFELEMDLKKNQYESGSMASPNAPQQEIDEAADKLAELARRQEQLARNLDRARTATPAQRWQQEMLRRDVEELRDRLERLQQQTVANQSRSQSGQSGQGSESGRQGSHGQPGDSSRELDDLRRRLDSAVRAMNEVGEAMRNGGNADDLRRASAEAQRQLEGARDRALEEQQRMLQASVSELTRRAGELYATQSALEDRLQEAIRSVLTGINEFERFDSGLTMNEEYEIAEEKRRLQAELQALELDARNSARNLDNANPRAAEEIREALRKLREMEIETRLAVAARYIEQGEAIYIAASESAVTQGLRELRDDLQRAQEMAGQGGEGRGGAGRDGFAETLAATQQLRRALQRLAEGNARGGALTSRGRDDLQQSTGVRIADLEFTRELNRQADNIYQDVIGLFRELRAAGTTVQDIDELRRLAADIRASDFSGNPDMLDAESRHALSLVEQLELALARTVRTNGVSVRANVTDEVPDEHKEIVADYYRKLGQVEESANQ
ncbi:MAG: hypothetical protein IIC61_00405, partial [Proteobacteria bacterium]|nr:hypothetical protein [Pseudomonadota bacterium]